MIRPPLRRRPLTRRIGFTLVELMVVIVIIGILMALLLPVIVGAVRRARDAQIAADIQTLSAGLAKFKDTYGEFPPSRVILSETGVYSASATSPTPVAADYNLALNSPSIPWYGATKPTHFGVPDISFGELANRSLRALRKCFPKAVLQPEYFPVTPPSLKYFPDFNGNYNGDTNTAADVGFIYLEGHECLVFFLGGIPSPTQNSNGSIAYGTSGFGREPRYPFKNSLSLIPATATSPQMSTANRTTPSYEFKGSRLYDEDGDGIPGYMDPQSEAPQGRFYAYFASYGAGGYDPNDNNCNSPNNAVEVDESGSAVGIQFRVGVPISSNVTASPAPNPYTTSLPAQPDTSGVGGFTTKQPAAYMNPNSYQIISAGGDTFFGAGGQYSTSGDKLQDPPNPPFNQPAGLRQREYDNITNFTSGRLN